MAYFTEIKDRLYKFERLGIEVSELGTILIGKAPHIAPLAWLHSMYPTLNDNDVIELENQLDFKVPDSYKTFLSNYSNGLTLFTTVFNLDGHRKVLGRGIEASRQPFSLLTNNVDERLENAKENYFFIGSYDWDGSQLYIDVNTGKVHFCSELDATSLYEWGSFEEMLLSETERIIKLFDENGVILDEDAPTTPVIIEA